MEIVIILAVFLVLMFLRIPVAFSMAASGVTALLMRGVPLQLVPQRMFGSLNSFLLLAIPIFIFVGTVMNTGGVTDRIFNFASAYVGHIRGGLGHVNVLASIIFAGMTGSAVSDAYGLGLIEINAMKERGFDADFSAAVTGASSIIGPIIPPSIPLVVYAMAAEQSVGRLFLGGVFPGILLGITMMVLVYFTALKRGYKTEPRVKWAQRIQVTLRALPALLVPVLMLSGIVFGVVTPTEGGILAAIYAVILGFFVYRELSLKTLLETLLKTAVDSASILLIIASSSVMSWVVMSSDIPHIVQQALYSVSGGSTYVLFVIIILILLVAGCFLEGNAIILLAVPIFLPTLTAMNVDLVHFGVVLVLTTTAGIITPPVGLALFITTQIAKITFAENVKATLPFLIPILATILLSAFIPSLVTFLPNLVMGA